jgi:hypothetical protein
MLPAERIVVTGVDGVNHLIYDAVLTEATDGRFRAICGAVVLAAPLAVAEGATDCPLCRDG